MTTNKAMVAAMQAQDTRDFLQHIAWADIVLPELRKIQDGYKNILVAAVLGTPLPDGLTKEILAGRVTGIDFAIKTISNIITKGDRAADILKDSGLRF